MTLLIEGLPTLAQFLNSAAYIFFAAGILWLAALPFRVTWKRIKALDDAIWLVQSELSKRMQVTEAKVTDLEARIHENQ